MLVRHLNFHALGRVKVLDVARRLLYELATMREDESLGCIACRSWCTFDEMAEDDRLAAAGGKG
jgi:hypothetical protein